MRNSFNDPLDYVWDTPLDSVKSGGERASILSSTLWGDPGVAGRYFFLNWVAQRLLCWSVGGSSSAVAIEKKGVLC